MANRERTNPVQVYLNDDEQYILDEKFKLSGMKSKSAFLRKLILWLYLRTTTERIPNRFICLWIRLTLHGIPLPFKIL